MFRMRVFGDSLPDNNGVITEVWDKSSAGNGTVRMFTAPVVTRRVLMREKRALKRNLIRRLKASGPPIGSRSVTAIVDYDSSFRYVREAYRRNDLDTLRACNKFLGYCEMQYVVQSVEAMRSLGYDSVWNLIDEEFLDIAIRIREALADENFSSSTSTKGMSFENLTNLRREAVRLAFSNPAATGKLIHLIRSRGIVDVDELRKHLDSMDGIGPALIDGAL